MNKSHFIYALVDPRTDEVRYVGKTVDLKRRMRRHRNIGRSENPSLYRDRWIQSLMDDGLDFIVWILDCCNDIDWPESEKKWIAHFKNEGCRLTNLTGGGDGWYDHKMTEAHKAALRKPKPTGFGEKVSARLKGVPKSKEHREKLSKVRMGTKSSQITKEKLSKASKKKWEDINFRNKVEVAKNNHKVKIKLAEGGRITGLKPKSLVTRERMSISAKRLPKTSCDFCGNEFTKAAMVLHKKSCDKVKEIICV